MRALKITGVVVLGAAFIAVLITAEVTVWTECRATNSVLYCFRLLIR